MPGRDSSATWRALALAVVSNLAEPAAAQDSGLEGSWQVDIDCLPGLSTRYATATSFLVIEPDVDRDGLVATIPICGTLAVPGSIQEMVQCETDPYPTPVGIDGTRVRIPPDGFFASVGIPESPFPFPLVGCEEVALISSSLQYDGTLTRNAGGRVTRIAGRLLNGPLEMEDSTGEVCFGFGAVPSCAFEMRRNEVEPGRNVSVEPRDGAHITFSEVLTAGTVGVVPQTQADATLPPGFRVVGGDVEVLFDVTTTAEFDGPITVCISYLDDDDDGFVDLTAPPVREENVRLLHEENGAFVDRTVSRDADRNQVCSRATSLSQFALGGSEVAPEPPGRRRIRAWRSGSGAPRGRRIVPSRR